MIYRLTCIFFNIAFSLFFRRRLIGVRNVPTEGPVIIAGNHVSYLDPPLVSTGLVRPCAFMAKEELFRNRFFAWYISRLNAFPVRRGTADRASLKRTVELLAEGWAFVIFPEGTRSETGELQEPEMGVGMIAYRTGAPVVPAYVWGTDQVMPRGGGFHFARIGVRYGEPMTFRTEEGARPGREEYEEAARRIMAAIAALREEHERADL